MIPGHSKSEVLWNPDFLDKRIPNITWLPDSRNRGTVVPCTTSTLYDEILYNVESSSTLYEVVLPRTMFNFQRCTKQRCTNPASYNVDKYSIPTLYYCTTVQSLTKKHLLALMFVLFFNVRPSDFAVYFKVRQVIRSINRHKELASAASYV